VGAGNLILQDLGFTNSGNLDVDAANIVDADSTVSLGATTATLNVRDGAAVSIFNLTADTLDMVNVGAGALTVNNTQDLTLARIQSGGDAVVNVTGDLTVTEAAPSVGGDLTLGASGDLTVPDAGLTLANSLTLSAMTFADTDGDISLTASQLQLTTSNAGDTADRTWALDTGTLDVTHAGTGALTLSDSGVLNVTGLIAGGDVDFQITGSMDFLTGNPTLGGDLSVNSSSYIAIPDAGFQVANGLSFQAVDVVDVGSDGSDLIMGADTAVINVTNGAADENWITQFNALTLTRGGVGAITLNNDRDIAINGLQNGGDTTLNVTGNLTLAQAAPTIGGGLTLSASGNVVVPDAGFSVANDLSVTTTEILDSTDADISLTASNSLIN